MSIEKRIIVKLRCDADEELSVSNDNMLILNDLESELRCCWHHFDIEKIEIKDVCVSENPDG